MENKCVSFKNCCQVALTVQVTEQWHRLPREGLIGNLQKLSGHGPGQPGLSIHA